jgi:hypothetical protein
MMRRYRQTCIGTDHNRATLNLFLPLGFKAAYTGRLGLGGLVWEAISHIRIAWLKHCLCRVPSIASPRSQLGDVNPTFFAFNHAGILILMSNLQSYHTGFSLDGSLAGDAINFRFHFGFLAALSAAVGLCLRRVTILDRLAFVSTAGTVCFFSISIESIPAIHTEAFNHG